MKVRLIFATITGTLALAACATPAPVIQYVDRDVPVPFHQPCPAPTDIPAQPTRVAQDHPAMPTKADGSVDYEAVSRILGAKVLDWITYGEKANGVMVACSK